MTKVYTLFMTLRNRRGDLFDVFLASGPKRKMRRALDMMRNHPVGKTREYRVVEHGDV